MFLQLTEIQIQEFKVESCCFDSGKPEGRGFCGILEVWGDFCFI